MSSLEKHWRLWAPLVSGLAFSRMCPVSGGERLPQTPPKRVFPIVWTILYACIGYSWKRIHSLFPENTKADVMHGILVCLLCAWLFTYACKNQKVYGFYVLAMIVATCVCCIALHEDKMSKILLTPLLAWTLIALQLNYHIADTKEKKM